MPLVSHFSLPTFDALRERGHQVLDLSQAQHQDIRELHIGFLNMMPDAAFQVTERQYFRLIGACNQIAQFFVHPFTVPGLSRGGTIDEYIKRYYSSFDRVQRDGLDALIITGANVTQPDLSVEPFWEPLQEVVQWAGETVTSVMCSCLASHAIVEMLYGVKRRGLEQKRWGVYQHHHRDRTRVHPLLRDVNTRFDIPHSRWNTLDLESLEGEGLNVLVTSRAKDVHLATSPDGFRFIFAQGHPEYDTNSLLKEYKREVFRYHAGARPSFPPVPENYFDEETEALCREFQATVDRLRHEGQPLEERAFPELAIQATLDNTWGDSGKAVFNNWLGLVYQLTHVDRKRPFLNGVDPDDPLKWRA